jgi:hypothetical protein
MIIFEGEQTFDLVVPILGTISAYATSWKIVSDPKNMRNGVVMDVTFREDQSNQFLITALVAKTAASFSAALADYSQALADQQGRLASALTLIGVPDPVMLEVIPSNEIQLFEEIALAAQGLLDLIAAEVTYGAGVPSAANDVVALCATADATSTFLSDPTAYPLLYAMQEVWTQATTIANDANQTGITLIEYVVPYPGQSVTQISSAVYGDASHAVELMQTNPIEDPFFVPGGTVITGYLIATTSAAA